MTDLTPLDSLKDIPPPRRTDAAFARSVKDGVRARRSRTLSFSIRALPALAAAAAAFAFLVMRTGPVVEVAPVIAMAPVTTAADPFDDDDALFALPELEGSSDDELAQLDRALDRKIARASENRRSR